MTSGVALKSIVAILLLSGATPALARQTAEKGVFPAGYTVRTEKPAESAADIVFVDMKPGWHITTGPAAILYAAAATASGEYRVEMESFLFDPAQRNEAYGFFIGGKNLDGEQQSYTYFVIRRSGEFLVKRRTGTGTPVVIDWKANPAILKYDDKGEAGTAKNILAVDVGRDVVRFEVNGREVASLPRNQVDTDGIVGLRVNHSLNLHVTRLDVVKR
jgi:hypothetical protein